MAKRDLLDHELVAPFSQRIGLQFRPAAENIAFGHDDFAGTLRQWINSSGHRANLLCPVQSGSASPTHQTAAERIGQW